MYLDCTSLETTLASLEPFLGTRVEQIIERLVHPDLMPTKEFLKSNIVGRIFESFPEKTRIPWPYDGIAWFHLTRISDPNCFLEGIHPVTQAIDQIWNNLEKACSLSQINLDWQGLRIWIENESHGNDAYLYRLKQAPQMDGPFGMLLLESVFQTCNDNHYLQFPETVQDICKEVQARTGVSISDVYQRTTRPAVVKFIDYRPCQESAEAAVFYAYASLWNLDYSSSWNIYFDNEGSTVPSSRIQWVKYVDDLLAS